MSYLLLIHENRGDRDTRSPQEALALYQEMTAFAGELARDGLLAGAESLKSDKHAIRLQERDGELQVLDGPFAESKEMVGGFFLLNCEDREQALAIAKRCPAVRFASVVIREQAPCHEG